MIDTPVSNGKNKETKKKGYPFVSNSEVSNSEVSNPNVSNNSVSTSETHTIAGEGVRYIDVSTLVSKYSGMFEVSVSNVSNTNLVEDHIFKKGSCYLYVSNLTRILNLLTNPTNILVIYTLTNIDYIYYNMFYKILKIDLIKIKRALNILEREGVIVQTKRNEHTHKYLEHLSTQRTVGQYHLNKIVFYSLSNHYKPFFEELMVLFEKDLSPQVVEDIKDYKRELRKSRDFIGKLTEQQSQQEKEFLMETIKLLKDKPYILDGKVNRISLYNNTFGQNITDAQFKFKLAMFKEMVDKK